MTTVKKTFELDYDTRSGDLPSIVVNYHGLVFRIYFYNNYEDIVNLDLTTDQVTYNYKAPSADECSVAWTREMCYFTFCYHEEENDEIYGGGTDLQMPLTPETYKEICDVFTELKGYSTRYDEEEDSDEDEEEDSSR